ENDFWRMISNQLDYDSQLVDVRLSANSQLKITESDLAFFNQAEKELFATDEFTELSKDWAKKDELSNQLENAPDFLQEVKELAEVKLNSKLKGISDEVKEN
ncbi:MAG: phosphoesterase, partial [Lactobacillus apis]|nr:phosphoesterase [Lactobacillus apis]